MSFFSYNQGTKTNSLLEIKLLDFKSLEDNLLPLSEVSFKDTDFASLNGVQLSLSPLDLGFILFDIF